MNLKTELEQFTPTDDVSHVEIANVNFDQWILTVTVRIYSNPDQQVVGMIHVVFENLEGFRVLDEGAMLCFNWSELSKSRSFVHRINTGGWFEMEQKAGNMHLPDGAQEYVIVTSNECVSVISYSEPTCVPHANE